MEFGLTEEQRLIQQSAHDFAQREIVPIAAEFDRTGEFPLRTIRMAGELGFMGVEVPEAYGGAGLDAIGYVLMMEEVSAADAAHGTIVSVNNSLYCTGILKYGTEEQKREYVTPVASGEAIAAYALTEPQSGSDAGNMRVRAQRSADGSEYLITGKKSWITSGPVAKYIILFAQTDPQAATRGVTAFIIDTDRPALVRGQPEPNHGL